jgi:hypothetical protein
LAARQPVLRLTPESTVRDTAAAARAIGLQVQVLNADTSREIDAAFGDVLTTVEQTRNEQMDGYFSSELDLLRYN